MSAGAVVRWNARPGWAGMRLRWIVHALGATMDFAAGGTADVASSAEQYEITDLTWPAGHVLSVELHQWTGFDAGAVAGDPGPAVVVQHLRPSGAFTPSDPVGALACRVTFDLEGELVYDNEHCLTLANP